MYAAKLATRLTLDPVSPCDLAAFQFGKVTVNADPEDVYAGECIFPVFKKFFR